MSQLRDELLTDGKRSYIEESLERLEITLTNLKDKLQVKRKSAANALTDGNKI